MPDLVITSREPLTWDRLAVDMWAAPPWQKLYRLYLADALAAGWVGLPGTPAAPMSTADYWETWNAVRLAARDRERAFWREVRA